MARDSTVLVDPVTSLDDLNTIVSQNEQVHGALKTMGSQSNPNNTVLTFENTQQKPTKNATISRDSDPAPLNSTKICSGTIYVASAPTACSAYRPN